MERNLQVGSVSPDSNFRTVSTDRSISPSRPPVTVFKPSQIIAWVGDQPIQAGDLMPMIDQALAPHLEKIPPEELESHRAEIEAQKEIFLKQALTSAIETKLLYLDFLRTIPADKLKEALPNITAQAEKAFYEKQLPDALKKAKVDSPMALDAKLKQFGSSLEQQKRMFVERALGQSVLSQQIDYEREVTRQEMLDYYHKNQQKFFLEAKAQYEKLTVLFSRTQDKAEAWAAIAYMGNEVLRGAPFAAVAQRNSHDIDAEDGGFHDWTTKGSLASEALDQAVFSLPVGRLSQRIEDERGFHIIRVVQRQEASVVPFVDAQVKIREEIRKEKIQEQGQDYIAKLKGEIPVWTAFDEQESAENPG